jgi:glycosyltransferase involved in cell wall biosynthesis
MKVETISCFFPAYNEEANIEKTVVAAQKVLENLATSYEIIVIDDGSTDKTLAISRRLASKNSCVRVISHFPNRGYGAALKYGLYSAKYDPVVYTDSDGQYDLSDVTKFLKKAKEADLVVGVRSKRGDRLAWSRELAAKLWNLAVFFVLGIKTCDVDCGFKLVKKKVLEKIPKLEAEGAMISVELLAKTKNAGFKIAEVPVAHHPRLAGRSTGVSLRVIFRAFKELFSLRKKLR